MPHFFLLFRSQGFIFPLPDFFFIFFFPIVQCPLFFIVQTGFGIKLFVNIFEYLWKHFFIPFFPQFSRAFLRLFDIFSHFEIEVILTQKQNSKTNRVLYIIIQRQTDKQIYLIPTYTKKTEKIHKKSITQPPISVCFS